MTPRLKFRVLGFVGLILLVSLLAVPQVDAACPPMSIEHPIGGEEGNEPPRGGPGGDGGDPDEFFLTEPPGEGVAITVYSLDPVERRGANRISSGWYWNWLWSLTVWTPWRF